MIKSQKEIMVKFRRFLISSSQPTDVAKKGLAIRGKFFPWPPQNTAYAGNCRPFFWVCLMCCSLVERGFWHRPHSTRTLTPRRPPLVFLTFCHLETRLFSLIFSFSD